MPNRPGYALIRKLVREAKPEPTDLHGVFNAYVDRVRDEHAIDGMQDGAPALLVAIAGIH